MGHRHSPPLPPRADSLAPSIRANINHGLRNCSSFNSVEMCKYRTSSREKQKLGEVVRVYLTYWKHFTLLANHLIKELKLKLSFC